MDIVRPSPVGEIRLARTTCTHLIFDDIHAHGVYDLKPQLFFTIMFKGRKLFDILSLLLF